MGRAAQVAECSDSSSNEHKRAITKPFSVLVRGSYPRLYAVARLILRDLDRAQDAVQEALVLASRDTRALRHADAWVACLNRLTVLACYRWVQKARRRDTVELHVAPGEDVDASTDFSNAVADREQTGRALARLPVDQRAVLVAHFYLGRSGVLSSWTARDMPTSTRPRVDRRLAT
jgi:DNA-directed RNA polymerase specialized sigma24 family protein